MLRVLSSFYEITPFWLLPPGGGVMISLDCHICEHVKDVFCDDSKCRLAVDGITFAQDHDSFSFAF